MKIALTGNPNSGKTTLFNLYTGSNQYVGNWAGVTVEKKEGSVKYKGESITLVDLPGIYSLSPYSMEEIVTRRVLIEERPDVLIDILDGTNIERNLYLALQLMELGVPMILAVNMMDEVRQKGDRLDCAELSRQLGVQVIPITAKKGENTKELLEAAAALARNPARDPSRSVGKVAYDRATEQAILDVYVILWEIPGLRGLPLGFYAAKLLEGDKKAGEALNLDKETAGRIERVVAAYEASSPYGDRETMLADARYKSITAMVEKAMVKAGAEGGLSLSDKIDLVITNRILALPIFLLIMFFMFALTFGPVGSFLSGGIDFILGDMLTRWVTGLLSSAAAPGWTHGLLVDAIIGGVGGVLTFLPQILILFTCLSVLEDSGYMARAAFIMDRLLHKIGLTGKSFIPMLMGFGCTTPAVMAARTMENDRDRKMTIMITPFMSCGAKLPVYALFASIFFTEHEGAAVFSMYIIGMVTAVVSGLFLRGTLFRGTVAPFVMELPPYRLPSPGALLRHVWEKAKGFLIKAGTIIFSMSVLTWLLQNLDWSLQLVLDNRDSIFASVGRGLAPIFAPLGFGNWQAAVSILAGLIAKETVVSSMLVLYGAGSGEALASALAAAFDPVSAFSFMVFCLLYMPCISAFVSIKREMNSWRWAILTAAFTTAVAYIISLVVYQGGRLIFG
ncbi:MAG: ferrous iron transport protein B [Oscillospiraceae bacterium]|jgi:ferrous iron transport protein B|nr:ferrous iron transport protein B [Oscillospiraceae bacterium]